MKSKMKIGLKSLSMDLLLMFGSVLVGISVGFIFLPLKLSTGGFSRNCHYTLLSF